MQTQPPSSHGAFAFVSAPDDPPAEVLSDQLERFLRNEPEPALARAQDANQQLSAGFGGASADLVHALETLQANVAVVDFTHFRKGSWLARATPQGRSAGARFVAQCSEVMQRVEAAKVCARSLLAEQERLARVAAVPTQAQGVALAQLVTDGAVSLGQCWRDISRRRAASSDAETRQQLSVLSARLELCAARLKLLHEAASALQESTAMARNASDQRDAFLLLLRQGLDDAVDAWAGKLASLVAAAEDAGVSVTGLPAAIEAQKVMVGTLAEVHAACVTLRGYEAEAAASLRHAGQRIDAVGR